MKIAVDIRHLGSKNLSGVGHYTVRLIRELQKLAEDDEFLLFASGSQRVLANIPEFKGSNVTVVKATIINRLLNLLLFFRIRTLESFLPENPDIWLFPNLNIVHTKLPYAITVHDMSFAFLPDVFTRKARLWHKAVRAKQLVQNAAKVLAVSKSTAQDVEEHWHVEKRHIAVTHLGVDKTFRPKVQPQDQNYLREYGIRFPYILTLSTLEPRKNLTSVVQAYTKWRAERNNDVHLVIAGGKGWKTKELFRAAYTSPYADDIHFVGYVEDKHRPTIFRHANAFLFPSLWEGFGLPPLEAMATGTPVITSFMSSLPEVVGNAGLLVDPYLVSDIVFGLELLDDDTITSRLIEKAIERAKTFTWQSTAEKTMLALKTINT